METEPDWFCLPDSGTCETGEGPVVISEGDCATATVAVKNKPAAKAIHAVRRDLYMTEVAAMRHIVPSNLLVKLRLPAQRGTQP
jgi:hypothetical protein